MSRFDFTTSIFYRWRYWIGYGLIVILFLSLLYVAAYVIPNGLTDSELRSVIASSQLNIGSLPLNAPLNAPYHLLQHGTLALFGISTLGIKLPSLILGLITALCMTFLLRRWFSPGIAVLAAAIAVTTGQFLFLAQQGSPGILYLFWPTVLLLLATLVANRVKYHAVCKALFFIAAALSLYTPLGIYVLIALVGATFLHPHLRYIVKRLPVKHIIANSVAALIILLPLLLTLIRDPSSGLRLLGIPSEWPNLPTNLHALFDQYFNFMSLGSSSVLLPVFGFASMLIILYGLLRLIQTRSTVPSHVVLIWTICLTPVLIINPAFISIMFVPLFLLLATGFEHLLRVWYRLFPRNPYARVAGLLPIVVLVASMTLFGLERYVSAYRYAPEVVRNFSQDILRIPQTATIVVAPHEKALYDAVAMYREDLTVTTSYPNESTYVVTSAAYDSSRTPSSVVTNARRHDAARFYLYQ